MSYVEKKKFFDQLLTVYGRNTVLEALQEQDVPVYKLHLAKSNRSGGSLDKIIRIAEQRGIELAYHSREELSRISRNQRQDQGVALDLQCPRYGHYRDFLADAPPRYQLIALDRITNPQNLGMVIRSVCASPMQGLLLPSKGCAPLSPLVIKASAGSIFHCPIYRCNDLAETLEEFITSGAQVCTLRADASESLSSFKADSPLVYVLGNETSGVSDRVADLAQHSLNIPMCNGVESLNVAVTAALLAFRDVLSTTD
jgi:23S rRNA (guanosine2251-2'-O)-methyltransferase